MIKSSLIIILLSAFCCASLFGQGQDLAKATEPINTKSIKFTNLKFSFEKVENDEWSCVRTLDESSSKLLKHLAKLISTKGMVEIDPYGNSVIIEDTDKRIDLITQYLKILDESGFSLEELFSKASGADNQLITEVIIVEHLDQIDNPTNIDAGISCNGFRGAPSNCPDVSPTWISVQRRLLLSSLRSILSSEKALVEINVENDIIVVESEKKFGLFRKIISLFDRPILVNETYE